jgi:hypothetical protein
MRQLIVTLALVAAALAITFGVGTMLEQTAFRAGPEPAVGLPAGAPVPVDRHGRSLPRSHQA